MVAAGNRGLALALVGITLLLALTLAAYRPPAPLGPDAAPNLFSAYRAKAVLDSLVGNGVPHPIGSPAAARVRENIVKRLAALGYNPELQSGFVCDDHGACGNAVNIIATLGGKTEDAVLLAAHYDSVPAGPGASDDGTGVAAMLEIARVLAARPQPLHPVVLLFTDGEEAGLLGASLFVNQHPLAKQVMAAVNLDARGTSGPSMMFETGTANAWLMGLYGAAIARPVTNSLFYVVYKLLPNDTDFSVFKSAAYQGFNFAFIGNVGRYHTPLDTAANADPGTIQHHGDNALAAISVLANSPSLRFPAAESVFADIFARKLISWPSQFTLPASLLSLILLLGEVIILVRTRVVAARQVIWGSVGTVCTLVSGIALSAALLALLTAVGKVPSARDSWISQPLPMHAAAAAIAFLAAGGASVWLARRAGFWGFWAAASLFAAVLSVASAVAVPGASFVFLATAIAAGLGALPAAVCSTRGRTPPQYAIDLAALLPVFMIFAAILPLLRFLYMALGVLAWPLSTGVLCLGTAALLPQLAAASERTRRGIIATAALVASAGVLITLGMPTYSAAWPERVNVEYWFDADTGQSHFLVRCESSRLPAALAAAAHFDPAPHPRFAGSGVMAFHAPAPPLALAAPELQLTSRSAATSPSAQPATHFELRLRSARGAPEALVVFPASAQVAEITLKTASGPVRSKLNKLRSGATLLDVVALPAAGVEFSFDAAGRLPAAVQVFDQSYAFPEGQSLPHARPPNAISSQDGDLTVVHHTVTLDPAADR